MSNGISGKLEGKVALVTGGSRGIGAAIAKRLAADGASVVITYAKDAKAASAVVEAIGNQDGKSVATQADAADVKAVAGAVEKAVEAFGQIDILLLFTTVAASRKPTLCGNKLTGPAAKPIHCRRI